MDVHGIYDKIMLNGGHTWSPNGTTVPVSGYISSVAGFEKTYPVNEFTPLDLSRYMRDKVLGDGVFFGAWVYKGRVYLDVSRHFTDYSNAMAHAMANEQYAIYDLARKDSIDV